MIVRLQEPQRQPFPFPYMLYVDTAVITTQDTQFFAGLQNGYADFLTAYQGKILSEQDIYLLIMKIVDVRHTSTYQAGFITGWMTALLEPVAGHTTCELIEMPQNEASTCLCQTQRKVPKETIHHSNSSQKGAV